MFKIWYFKPWLRRYSQGQQLFLEWQKINQMSFVRSFSCIADDSVGKYNQPWYFSTEQLENWKARQEAEIFAEGLEDIPFLV